MEEDDLRTEKMWRVFMEHYNINESNAICRMINDKDMNLSSFILNLNHIVHQQDEETDDEEYINWLEDLSI